MTSPELPIHDDGYGNLRPLGHLPTDPFKRAWFPGWTEAGNPVIPESEWVEFDLTPPTIPIKNQDGKGACNGHAAATSLEIARFVAGMPHVELSAWMIYAKLCGGWDRGSSIGDALEMLQTVGTCPDKDFPYAVINPNKITSQNTTDAKRFRIEQGLILTTAEEIGSAIQLRRPLNLSVTVGSGFNNLDSEGVPGLGWGANNHAVCVALGMKKSAKWGWLGKMWNSWDVEWGWHGFCWLPIKKIIQYNAFECYGVIATTDDPSDATRPPVIV